MEIRPNIDWDKGRALQYLLETFGFDPSNDNVFPLYIGDDKTDEDAFTVRTSLSLLLLLFFFFSFIITITIFVVRIIYYHQQFNINIGCIVVASTYNHE